MEALREPDDTEMSVSGRIPNWYTNSMRTLEGREPHASMDHEAGGLQSDRGQNPFQHKDRRDNR